MPDLSPPFPLPRRGDRQKLRHFTKQCGVCGGSYQASQETQRACSDPECRRILACAYKTVPVAYLDCEMCGELFTYSKFRKHGGGKLCCSESCRDNRIKRRTNEIQARRYRADPAYRDRIIDANHSRRARDLGLGSETILLTYLIRRDHSRCGICRKMVRAKAGPRRPSIDHIIPLSRGGENVLANVQLAHLDCNIAKQNRGHGEQLLLIG